MTDAPVPGPGRPTPPIALGGDTAVTTARFAAQHVEVSAAVVERLRGACGDVSTDPAQRSEASRDWWPLAMTWALDNEVGGRAEVVCRPTTTDEVAAIASVCHAKGSPSPLRRDARACRADRSPCTAAPTTSHAHLALATRSASCRVTAIPCSPGPPPTSS